MLPKNLGPLRQVNLVPAARRLRQQWLSLVSCEAGYRSTLLVYSRVEQALPGLRISPSFPIFLSKADSKLAIPGPPPLP